MKKDNFFDQLFFNSFFAKVQTAIAKLDAEPTLSTEEQRRLTHLLISGCSPEAAANAIIANRTS